MASEPSTWVAINPSAQPSRPDCSWCVQTLAYASTYYLPAVLATPMARDLGVDRADRVRRILAGAGVSACVGPAAGRLIDRRGGRPVLMATNLLFASGCLALGWRRARGAAGWRGRCWAWPWAAACTKPRFRHAGPSVRQGARNAITGITLIAGFASTVGWPLTAVLEITPSAGAAPVSAGRAAPAAGPAAERLACADRQLHPARRRTVQARRTRHLQPPAHPRGGGAAGLRCLPRPGSRSTAMAVTPAALLQAMGASLAVAVGVGTLVGPAQVAGRLLEFGLAAPAAPTAVGTAGVAGASVGGCGPAAGRLGPGGALFALLHGAGQSAS
jgi:hypothetical protein